MPRRTVYINKIKQGSKFRTLLTNSKAGRTHSVKYNYVNFQIAEPKSPSFTQIPDMPEDIPEGIIEVKFAEPMKFMFESENQDQFENPVKDTSNGKKKNHKTA